MECYFYLRNIQDLWSDAKTPYERRCGIPFDGPGIPFGAMVEYHLFLRTYCQVCSLDMRYTCGEERENLEKRHSNRRHKKNWSRGRVWNQRQNVQCKGRVNAHEGWQFHVPSRRWNPSTLIRDRPERGEEQEILRGESDGLSSPTPTSTWQKWFLVCYRRFHLSPSLGTPSQIVRAKMRIFLCSAAVYRRKHSYIVGWYAGKENWWLLERGWRSWIVSFVDRIHKIYNIERKTTGWIFMVRWETDDETEEIKSRHCVASCVETHVGCIKTQRKAEVGCRKIQKNDDARKLRGVDFIDPGDDEFMRVMNNARRKRNSDAVCSVL